MFKGTYGGDGVVAVNDGNRHVKKADLVGQNVQFDLSGARPVIADTNADGSVTADDSVSGDRVVVQAPLPKQDLGTRPIAAGRLVDQSDPPAGGDRPQAGPARAPAQLAIRIAGALVTFGGAADVL